jgi:uncharacterized protein (DUF1015 family)
LGVSSDEHVTFVKDENEAINKMSSGDFEMLFLLNPTRIGSIVEIAGKGERLPQKSTYFYPKLISGIVMNKVLHAEKIT